MAKKLLINCGTCDARNTKEETLTAYESITINCGDIFVSPETRDLLNRHGVTMNCGDIKELDKDAKIIGINGSHHISGSTLSEGKTYLEVNGTLTISPDAAEVLNNYVGISVNGKVLCPESASNALSKLDVNGSVVIYPDEAVILKRNAVIDRTFALRAKEKLYWSEKRLIMVDTSLNTQTLAAKGTAFAAQEVIIAESLVESILERIDEKAEILIVPDGTSVITSDLDLDAVAIKKYGTKLYVLGDLKMEIEDTAILQGLEYLNVQGNVTVMESMKEAMLEALTHLGGELKVKKHPQGRQIKDKMSLRITRWMLEQKPNGIEITDCMKVRLDEDIPNDLILDKLTIHDVMTVACTPEQEAAVAIIADDVMDIGQKEENEAGFGSMVKTALGMGKELLDTKVINAGDYVL